MRVLALDTSHSTASIAIVEVGASPWAASVLSTASARASNAHGESLLPIVDGVLRAAGLTLADVELVAVGIGPGSFTGTRVGVATAKGLAIGAEKPLAGVEGFDALAAAAHAASAPSRIQRGGEEIAVAVDARKGEVYMATVLVTDDDARRVGEALHAPPGVAWSRSGRAQVPRIACGDGARLVPVLANRIARGLGETSPDAAVIAALAGARRIRAGADAIDEIDTLEPLYVRPPDITVPTRQPGMPRPAS